MNPMFRLSWQMLLSVCLCYALLVGVMTLPAPFMLSTTLIGNNIDDWIFYWNNWWLKTALAEGHNIFFTPYAFAPEGASLAAHSNSFLNSLLSLPLDMLFGPVVAYNVVWLFSLWIGAVGMFLLVYDLTHSPAGALFAGFIFTFAPYHLTQALAHAHLGSIQWWPFYAYFLRRALHVRRYSTYLNGTVIIAGFFATLTFWTGLQLAIMLALWTLLYVTGHIIAGWYTVRQWRATEDTQPSPRPSIFSSSCHPVILSFRHFVPLLWIGLVALLLSLPLLIPVAREWESGWTEGFDEGVSKQTDLLAYFIPPTYHPIVGNKVNPIYERFIANRAYMPYLGYTSLMLSALSLFSISGHKRVGEQGGRRAREQGGFTDLLIWMIGLGVWMLLAAGNTLRINGTLYPQIPLPYRWLGDLFPISTLRSPDRLNLLVVFSLAVLAGYGSAWLARRRRWLLLPAGLLMIGEYLCLPLLHWELPSASPFYAQMAQEPPVYSVLDYPPGYNEAKLWLYAQTLHGKPTIEGHISRYTPDLYSLIVSNPLVRALYQPQVDQKPMLLSGNSFIQQTVPLPALGPALRELTDVGVRYILFHKDYLVSPQVKNGEALIAHFQRVLPVAPIYEDATLAVYDLTAPLSVSYAEFPVMLADSRSLARFDVQHDPSATHWQFQIIMQAQTPVASLPCEIVLMNTETTLYRESVTFFTADADWQVGDLDIREVALDLALPLMPGVYRWHFTCGNFSSYIPPEILTVTETYDVFYQRESSIEDPSPAPLLLRPLALFNVQEGDYLLEGSIALLGYRWRTEGARLWLDLNWQAVQAPKTDYKVFVHFLNHAGDIVAQYDAFPCAWTCPTRDWQAGQIVHDSAYLDLWTLLADTYTIALGLYNAETGERLPATTFSDGYVVLPDTFKIMRNK
ncbi:MAG: hypothetical protein JXA33_12880 [Anaerolineae bacterium]|nr:hypothetical protein [Anaerolineae bacterium]